MLGTVLYGARDVRYEEVPEPKLLKPADAIIRLAATCVCGSDLWPYRGINDVKQPMFMGHEYCGVVEEVGNAVKTVKPGQFVVGSFCLSDNTCPNCTFGYQSVCEQREFMTGAQAPYARVALADGTLLATAGIPSAEMISHLLATSDVLGTGWFAAEAAEVKPGATVVVVGDGAVGLLAALAAKQLSAERVVVMSRHEKRQILAKDFGATDIISSRGDEGVTAVKELTKGIGADCVLECVGTQESMHQAIRSARPGGHVSFVGVPHDIGLAGEELFWSMVHLHGGPAPVRRSLQHLIDLVWEEKIQPGKSSTSICRLPVLPKRIRRWTNGLRSKHCFVPEVFEPSLVFRESVMISRLLVISRFPKGGSHSTAPLLFLLASSENLKAATVLCHRRARPSLTLKNLLKALF